MALTEKIAVAPTKKRATKQAPPAAKTWHKTMPKRAITLAAALREPQSERLFPDT